ncbi:hypothetical protein B4U80_05562 [Leptotrombidium deliense]|uniref:Glycoside hydrolase family 19 catalytic domain-containing protein n=1 Tax=Leptotrombidium deliense TaxID=299467 RepID=A0A443SFN7_9ACAR|nr:hypothetical protein B4U80_05562 [Leptotrombidium deliense]
MLLLIHTLLLSLTACEECWWSGCQLDSWAEIGCFPEDEWHPVNKTQCDGGNFYKCCKTEPGMLENGNATLKTTQRWFKRLNFEKSKLFNLIKGDRSDCWWSGCQPNHWSERGCFPSDQWQAVESMECETGDKFHCCKKEENKATTKPSIIRTAQGDCWWSGCQPVEWGERGCFPSEDWEQLNFLSLPVDMNFQEFQKAVVDCGYDTPTQVQYKALISQATSKGAITSKRELAMFLAQILWESGGLKYKKEIACEATGCPGVYDSSVGVPGKNYYGRGYIQLTHSFNYKAASQELYSDDRLIRNPELVSDDEQIAWATAFWFWKRNVHNRPKVQQGFFGASTNAINGDLECAGDHKDRARRRFELYQIVLKAFHITETAIENGCYN